jgi:hypothetical protein
VSAGLSVVSEVVPQQVVQNGLGDSVLPQVVYVPLLVTPFNPSRSLAGGVDQDEAVDALGVLQSVAQKDVGTHTDAQADIFYHGEVVEHLVDMLGQRVHRRIFFVVGNALGPLLLARRVDVKHAKVVEDLAHLKRKNRNDEDVIREIIRGTSVAVVVTDLGIVEKGLKVGDVVEAQVVVSEDARFLGVSGGGHRDEVPVSHLDALFIVGRRITHQSPVERSHRAQLHLLQTVDGGRAAVGHSYRAVRHGHATTVALDP